MKNKIIVIFFCIVAVTLESSDNMPLIGMKRVRTDAPRSPRKKPKLVSLEEEFVLHLHEGNINEMIDMIDDFATEGNLTHELGRQINSYIEIRQSSSPMPEVFVPVQKRVRWLLSDEVN